MTQQFRQRVAEYTTTQRVTEILGRAPYPPRATARHVRLTGRPERVNRRTRAAKLQNRPCRVRITDQVSGLMPPPCGSSATHRLSTMTRGALVRSATSVVALLVHRERQDRCRRSRRPCPAGATKGRLERFRPSIWN